MDQAAEKAWRPSDVTHLLALDLHPIPVRGKFPLIKWRHGGRDYVHEKPTPDEVEAWIKLNPEGWAVVCGGLARVVVLDVESDGWDDEGTQGAGIRQVVASLPDTCLRPSPSGGVHAYLKVMDGPAPDGRGGRLVTRRREGDDDGYVLLAELRAEGHYAVILGPGRGVLEEGFKPHVVSRSQFDAILEELRGLSHERYVAPGTSSKAGTIRVAGRGWLDRLPAAQPCRTVLAQAETSLKMLAADELTPAILPPVLKLVRMATHGHQGVPEILGELRTEFLRRVELRGNRPGGRDAAAAQWERSITGAVGKVPEPDWLTLGDRRVCPCYVEEVLALHRSARPPFTSTGRGRTSETLVLEHLASRVSRTGRPIVHQSQRQISLATLLTLRPVNHTIQRLTQQGWLVSHKGVAGSIQGLELSVPECIRETTKNTSGEGVSVVSLMNAELHHLFGPHGLGPGPAETFSHLPELRRKFTRGSLVRVSPGATRDVFTRAPSQRALPPAVHGPAPTVRQLAELTMKSISTVRRHLTKLNDVGLAFCDDSGRWWRYRTHPDWVVERFDIVDPTPTRKDLYDRERRAWFLPQVAAGKVDRLEEDGVHKYVDHGTGEILWVDRCPRSPDVRAATMRSAPKKVQVSSRGGADTMGE